jgi:hypothetical protein
MGKVIHLKDKSGGPPDNLITAKPLEFRSADWESGHFIQMLKSQSEKLEKHRREVHEKGDAGVHHLPPHYVLGGSMAYTIRSIFSYRANEEKMREVYYLAGLMDCMINRVHPLLRSEDLGEMYKKIVTLKTLLSANWYGTLDQVLFPLDVQFYDDGEYRDRLSRATTMKDLYHVIREQTDDMLDILSLEYVFYTPGRGTGWEEPKEG